MAKITFIREPNEIWYREYHIYVNGNYDGWISKYRKNNEFWEVFSSRLDIGPIKRNDSFKLLKDAKAFIKERVDLLEKTKMGER